MFMLIIKQTNLYIVEYTNIIERSVVLVFRIN